MKPTSQDQMVILAGGLGTRLGDLTKHLPKPLVPVAGRPFLDWQLRFYRDQGFSRFLLLTGYRGDLIEETFGDGSRLGIQINYSRETQPLGTGGALMLACSQLAETFLMAFGDSFLPISTYDVLNQLRTSGGPQTDVVMTVYDNRENTDVPFNVGVRNNRVVKYQKTTQPGPDLTCVEAGVYAVRRSVVEQLAPEAVAGGRLLSFEADVLEPSIEKERVAAWDCDQRFFDIGTPARLKLFEDRLSDYF